MTAQAQAQTRKRNVLFVAIDDLNTELGCYGSPVVKSPHIDALAARSVRFDRAYCQYPLCNPTRSSLLTGRRPPTTRITGNDVWFRANLPDVVTLPQHFKENGYTTAQSGKIYHGGLDDNKAWTIGGTPLAPKRGPRTPAENAERVKRADRWMAVDGEGETQADYRTATRAIELLEQVKDKPFFLAVGFVKPHVPFVAPKKYFDLYDSAKIQLPPDFGPRPAAQTPAYRDNFDIFIKRDASEKEAREMIAGYYAATSFMDAQLGRVMAALVRLGLRENTAVVFFGDHGFHLGEKGMWSKQTLFEGGVRVPMTISAPWLKTAGASPRTVEFVDLYPTLSELCGLPPSKGLEGESLLPLLKNPNSRWDHPAYSYIQRGGQTRGATVRTERYRYTEWNGGAAGVELYDYSSDPRESRNFAQGAKYAATLRDMKALLAKADWQ